MIYTSYFAKLRKMPKDVTPICIARKLPPKVDMLCCPKLYPTSQMLYHYKENNGYTEEHYIRDYDEYVLNLIEPQATVDYLLNMAKTEDIVLVCYEKTGSFCHRNLVTKWLNDNGIECKEWSE